MKIRCHLLDTDNVLVIEQEEGVMALFKLEGHNPKGDYDDIGIVVPLTDALANECLDVDGLPEDDGTYCDLTERVLDGCDDLTSDIEQMGGLLDAVMIGDPEEGAMLMVDVGLKELRQIEIEDILTGIVLALQHRSQLAVSEKVYKLILAVAEQHRDVGEEDDWSEENGHDEQLSETETEQLVAEFREFMHNATADDFKTSGQQP